MELLEQETGEDTYVASAITGRVDLGLPPSDERAARRSMRAQIGRLERDLSDAFVTAYPLGGLRGVRGPVARDHRRDRHRGTPIHPSPQRPPRRTTRDDHPAATPSGSAAATAPDHDHKR